MIGSAIGRAALPRTRVALAVAFSALTTNGAAVLASSADPVARGRYLAALTECLGCHSPLLPGESFEVPVPGRLGAGDILDEAQRLVAPNITPDIETGSGRWTDAQMLRAIREGIGHDGRRLSQAMPYAYFSALTDDDARAIVAWVRSLPPVRNRLPRWTPVDVGERLQEPLRPPTAPAALADHRERGGYLVRLGRCARCHTPRPPAGSQRQRRLDLELGGGRRFATTPFYSEVDPDPWSGTPPAPGAPRDVLASANITPDASGIAHYDESVFIQTIRTGRVAGIRPLSNAMPWWTFNRLTDDDLRAIFLYLRSVPPVRHRVNNTDPATWCPRCGRKHGLGALNRP